MVLSKFNFVFFDKFNVLGAQSNPPPRSVTDLKHAADAGHTPPRAAGAPPAGHTLLRPHRPGGRGEWGPEVGRLWLFW